MKILIPVIGFGKSGGFRVLSQLANNWIEQGHNVSFILPNKGILPYFPTKADLIWIGVDGSISLPPDKNDVNFYGLFKTFIALARGINRIKNDFDIILANQSLSTYPIFFSKTKAKKFYYIQAFEPEYYAAIKNSYKVKIMQILSWLSYLLPFTRIVNADIYKKYKNISAKYVVNPGIDFENFYPNQESTKIQNNKNTIVIGCIGRIEPYKGTQFVLEAFKMLDDKKFELHIAFGEELLANEDDGVFICIPKNDMALADYYRSLDILIAPGTVQLGAVHYPVIEAMACAIPVITTNYYPANESNSWIVPIKNSNQIVKQIKQILLNKDISTKKIKKAEGDVAKFAWKKVSQEMIDIFVK